MRLSQSYHGQILNAILLEFQEPAFAVCAIYIRTQQADHSADTQVGWKHQEAVKELEDVRKARSHEYYVAKRKLKALKTKATATVEEQA